MFVYDNTSFNYFLEIVLSAFVLYIAVFTVKKNGSVETISLIPRNISTTFVLNIFVMDSFMKSIGETRGRVSVSITFNVNSE